MKRVFVAFIIMAWAASAQARWQDSDCRPFTLPAQDVARIRTAAKAVEPIPLDPHSTGGCRHRQRDWFTASFDTIRILQADGSERWKSLTCRSDFRRQAPWKCDVWADTRAIRLSATTTARSLEVAIPDDMDVTQARQHVVQALALLEQPGGIPFCGFDEAGRTPHALRATTAQLRPISELREDIGEGSGNLVLTLDPGGFVISHDLLFIHYVFVPPERAAQLLCWEREEIVVTS